jgi:hypothetical protein
LKRRDHWRMLADMSETAPEDNAIDLDASDEWLSAEETYRRIANRTASPGTHHAIAQRAHAGILRAKAQVFIRGRESWPDAEIPKEFWWADGHEALTQNWSTGDFETWIDRKIHMRALGVCFHLGDLRKSFPDVFKPDPAAPIPVESAAGKAGRPPAEWWDDLWIEMCRSLYRGDRQPQRLADIEKAMNDWIAAKGESAATSTVRGRARKLWQAISRKDEN